MQWWRPLPLRGSRAGQEIRAAVGGPADQGEGSLAVFRIRTHEASWEFSDGGVKANGGNAWGRVYSKERASLRSRCLGRKQEVTKKMPGRSGGQKRALDRESHVLGLNSSFVC